MTVHHIADQYDVTARTGWRLLEQAGCPVTDPDDWRRRPRTAKEDQ